MNLNFLLELVAGTITQAGESKLVEVLNQLHKDQPADYKAACAGGLALVTHLQPLVSKTGTKIDDIFINGIEDAINMSLASTGESL